MRMMIKIDNVATEKELISENLRKINFENR